MSLRYDDRVVIVTGAGGGLGKTYALFFASRGAKVVVNDLGGSLKGEKDGEASAHRPADVVVDEIKRAGGAAVANYDSVTDGDKIVKTAIDTWGRIDIVINNAGILRDVSFKKMTDKDWDLIYQVHVLGAYKVTHAAWPYFRKQKYGRVVNTASAAGLYGNFGQTNYSAAKLALVGFTETLAKEGLKYNIRVNAIAPLAASRMTETILPPDVLELLKPAYIVPLVAYLVHDSSEATNAIFELGAGYVGQIRWERSNGALFKTGDSFTPSAILAKWDAVGDFDSVAPEHPTMPNDFLALAQEGEKLGPNPQGPPVDLKDKVVIVTGAGAGIGRAYALLAAKLGAKVVVNDFADPQTVVDEITKAGGTAVADKSNVVDGAHVVATAVKAFGTVHAVINNAGILRDKSFQNMTDGEWQQVLDVHLKGTYAVTKAAWPYFLEQKYGRVINTTSTSGIYGNFGQANYAAAKAGILGFSRALAKEGEKYNIYVNAFAPNAATAMTQGLWTPELIAVGSPAYIAPLAALLISEQAPQTGGTFEVGSGWIGETRWQRSSGHIFTKAFSPEDIAANFDAITNFDDGKSTHPSSGAESSGLIFQAVEEARANATDAADGAGENLADEDGEFDYNERSIILYNLGVGAPATDLKYTFEGDDDFGPLPTFGVMPYFTVNADFSKVVPNFNPMKLLHGEHYLEILQWPIPTEGTLLTDAKLLDVIDKGKAAVVRTEHVSRNKETGDAYFRNVSSTFIRGSGGFGGPKDSPERGAITAANAPPARAPDFTGEFKTSVDQAALYRLSGDFNPLHIDPAFAAVGGFPQPILHGLCTFGISARLLTNHFGRPKNLKVRFAGHVFPGETLVVRAWKEGGKVIFETDVKERKSPAIRAAALELADEGKAKI